MLNTPESSPVATDAETDDAINHLAGISPDSPLGKLRAQRPEVMRSAQASYEALLEPDDPGGVSRSERAMIALRVAVLTPSPAVAARHHARLHDLGTSEAVVAAVEHFPDRAGLSAREAAILGYTDRLTREPGTAAPADIATLKAAGLSAQEIVTIAQLIAYMSFAVRLLAGLRLLAEDA